MTIREMLFAKSPCNGCLVRPACTTGMTCPNAIHYIRVLERRDNWRRVRFPELKFWWELALFIGLYITLVIILW